jgi:hypothetical protein
MRGAWNLRAIPVLGMLVLVGCGNDRGDPDIQALPADGLQPTEQMQQTLMNVVEAQERHFEAHGRYSEDVTVLLEQHNFRPVGQTAVTIGFMGTEPQWQYLATATHPEAPATCEVNAGRRPADQQPYVGSMTC